MIHVDVSAFSPLFEHMNNDYTSSVVVRIKKINAKSCMHAHGPPSDSDYMKEKNYSTKRLGLTWYLKNMD